MGAYDGGECCDICVLYLLSQLQHLNINIGAYKDDWLGVSNQTSRCTEKTRQELDKIFRANGLTLDFVAINKKTVNFLDITLNLETGLFEPYMKENNQITWPVMP